MVPVLRERLVQLRQRRLVRRVQPERQQARGRGAVHRVRKVAAAGAGSSGSARRRCALRTLLLGGLLRRFLAAASPAARARPGPRQPGGLPKRAAGSAEKKRSRSPRAAAYVQRPAAAAQSRRRRGPDRDGRRSPRRPVVSPGRAAGQAVCGSDSCRVMLRGLLRSAFGSEGEWQSRWYRKAPAHSGGAFRDMLIRASLRSPSQSATASERSTATQPSRTYPAWTKLLARSITSRLHAAGGDLTHARARSGLPQHSPCATAVLRRRPAVLQRPALGADRAPGAAGLLRAPRRLACREAEPRLRPGPCAPPPPRQPPAGHPRRAAAASFSPLCLHRLDGSALQGRGQTKALLSSRLRFPPPPPCPHR